jgi:hypothetical protein
LSDSTSSTIKQAFENAGDILFGLDILLNFNTGIYKNGLLIMNRRLIMLDYLTSWFLIDVTSTFPYSLVMDLT